MSLYRLGFESLQLFDDAEEVAPNLHYASVDETLTFVIGGFVARVLDGEPDPPGTAWLEISDQLARERAFSAWLEALPAIDVSPATFDAELYRYWGMRGFSPRFPFPVGIPPPIPLPFETQTPPDGVYYRFEAFPISRRIDQASRSVSPGTYVSPASELPFMPTGFAAVARNALPLPYPACFRWELQPEPTTVRCGAVLPNFGQSGGGVEVCFVTGAKNRGPIANPVILDPL